MVVHNPMALGGGCAWTYEKMDWKSKVHSSKQPTNLWTHELFGDDGIKYRLLNTYLQLPTQQNDMTEPFDLNLLFRWFLYVPTMINRLFGQIIRLYFFPTIKQAIQSGKLFLFGCHWNGTKRNGYVSPPLFFFLRKTAAGMILYR